jgi:hypothetical protein
MFFGSLFLCCWFSLGKTSTKDQVVTTAGHPLDFALSPCYTSLFCGGDSGRPRTIERNKRKWKIHTETSSVRWP